MGLSSVLADRWRACAVALVAAAGLMPPAPARAQSCTAPAFSARTDFATTGSAVWVGAADFDRDGSLDLLATTQTTVMSLRRGNGAGGFLAEVTIPSGLTTTYFAVIGDFNRDGRPDIAVVDGVVGPPGRLAILLAAGAPGSFAAPVVYSVGSFPTSVVAADFDRDGDLDLAVANENDTFVSILLNNGSGTFSAGPNLGLSGVLSITAGDFNRDGFPDLAGLQRTPAQVSVVFGTGGGNFGSPATYPVTGQTEFIGTEDLDRDGNLDLAVVSDGAGLKVVSVLLGTTSGTFGAATDYLISTFGNVWALAFGDFNGDGKADVAVSRNSPTQVAVMLGDGAGGFGAPTAFTSGGSPTGVAVGDFDRDGRTDLVTSNPGTPPTQLSVFRDLFGVPCANASFGPATRGLAVNVFSVSLAKGDLNGDGRLDIVTVEQSSNTLSVLLANGPGSFAAASIIGAGGTQPSQAVMADFNLDGKLDLAVTTIDPGGQVRIHIGNGSGGFALPTPVSLAASAGPLAVGDLNNDGKMDLAVGVGASGVAILRGTGTGTFSPATYVAVAGSPTGVALGDFNGDFKLDLAVTVGAANTCFVFLGDGTGGFGPATSFPVGTNPILIATGDFNKDGRLDFATANRNANSVTVRLGDGLGGFGTPTSFPVGTNPQSVSVGDFDGDGNPDLATGDIGSSTVSLLRGNGAGSFGPATSYPAPGGIAMAIVGDFTGDGMDDVASVNGAGSASIFRGNGVGGLDVAPRFAAGTTPFSLTTGDVDRDGRLDLAVVNTGSDDVTILAGDGAGGFNFRTSFPAGLDPRQVVVGEFNRDGIPDLAVAASTSNQVRIFFGNGDGTFSSGPVLASGNAPWSLVAADLDRDGDLDLAVANNGSATVRIFLNDGSGNFSFLADLAAGASPVFVTAADVSRDGILDLLVANQGGADTVSVLLGAGGAAFGPRTTFTTGFSPSAIAVADLNRDGNPDFAVADFGSNNVVVYRGTGAGGFVFGVTLPSGRSVQSIVAADVNGDGKLDLVAGSQNYGAVAVHLGDGALGFNTPVYFGAGATLTGLALGDFDRDGRPDLAASLFANAVAVLRNSNCNTRRLAITTDVPACTSPGVILSPAPALATIDDGANALTCDGSTPVGVSLLPGSGTAGATLTGTLSKTTSGGAVAYSDLKVDLPGKSYRLKFASTTAGGAWSRRFSQGLAVVISGDTAVCTGQAASFSATLGFDTYLWKIDGAAASTAPILSVSGFSTGPHTLDVTATADGCSSADTHPLNANPLLSSVSIAAAGSTAVCPTCAGGTAGVTDVGGGPLTHEWGWRATSGGGFNPIAGATFTSYTISGADFNSGIPGVYFLVERTTPLCGSPTFSNEIRVIVFTVSAGGDAPFVAATSNDGQNLVQWLNPGPPYSDTLVRYTAVAGGAGCAPPADPGAGTELSFAAGVPGAKGSFLHSGLADDNTTYCYAVFVHKGSGVFSPGKSVTGRPFDTATGRVKWAYNVGMAAIVPPGNGVGVIHAVAQDQTLHSVLKGAAGGTWPASWIPQIMNGPSQGRPSTVVPPGPILGAGRLIFLGSQGGSVYAINADTGGVAWNSILPLPAPVAPVQAAPSGYFTFFGGTRDYILVGTRDGTVGALNRFYALKLADGTVGWSYDGSANGLKIGVINGQATVDYASRRVYFASAPFGGGPGEQETVWCLDLETGARIWSAPLGNVMGSPIVRNGRLYAASYDGGGGKIHALDAATGLSVWGGATTFDTAFADGPVKLFVSADRFSPTGRLLFSTTNKVWALDDPAGVAPPATPLWVQATVPNPSAPAFRSQGPLVWVGGSDSHVYALDYATGAVVLAIPLGDPLVPAAVGGPTLDLAAGFLYVGTEAGILYAVQIP